MYYAAEKLADDNKIYWRAAFSAKSTDEADYLEEEGEILIVKMSGYIKCRVRVAGGKDGWPTSVGTTGKKGMSKYQSKSDTMTVTYSAGSWQMSQTCNLLYNLGLEKTVDEEYKSGTVSGRPTSSGATGDKMDVYRPKSHQINETDLVNYPVSSVYESTVKVTDGIPLVICSDEGTLKFDMTLLTDTAGESDYIKFGFKKNASFLNNTDDVKIQDGLDINIETAVATHNKTISVEIRNLKKKDVIWMKAYPLTGNYATGKIENLVVVTE